MFNGTHQSAGIFLTQECSGSTHNSLYQLRRHWSPKTCVQLPAPFPALKFVSPDSYFGRLAHQKVVLAQSLLSPWTVQGVCRVHTESMRNMWRSVKTSKIWTNWCCMNLILILECLHRNHTDIYTQRFGKLKCYPQMSAWLCNGLVGVQLVRNCLKLT
jgi:hypothetical protein